MYTNSNILDISINYILLLTFLVIYDRNNTLYVTDTPYLNESDMKKRPFLIPETFVEEVSHRLNSSLQIDKALYEVLCYLRNFLPVDNIHSNIINTQKHYVRYLASATVNEGGVLIDERIPIPEHLIKDNFSEIKHGDAVIFNQVSKNPVVRELLRNHLVSDYANQILDTSREMSMLACAFKIGYPMIGFFIMIAQGENQYQESDRKLLSSLERPLTGAILNLYHHREVQIRNEQLERDNASLHDRLGLLSATRVVGAETGLKNVMEKVNKVATTESPVLITGETGAGKEVVARAIHEISKRSNGPMRCINCGAIPESLMDSELFGHVKGAFTGATELKRGYFEQANGGTIFLDEIAELSLEAQVKLLRVLEEKSFHRVGGSRQISVDIRIIAATNKDLAVLAQKNLFREDLWFRLNVFPIHIPPLRERKGDIKILAEYFSIRMARDMNLKFQPRFSEEAITQLSDYDWPGNIRELQNVIERSLITCNGETLSYPGLETPPVYNPKDISGTNGEEKSSFPLLETVITEHILKALKLSSGKVDGKEGAASLLGLHASTLRGKMRKLGIVQKKIVRNNS